MRAVSGVDPAGGRSSGGCTAGAGSAVREEGVQMGKVVVVENVTLDGVMQAPGRPDEDPRGGFEHGGWALPYNDPVMGR